MISILGSSNEKMPQISFTNTETIMTYYLTGFVFTGYGEGDRKKIVALYNSQETAKAKLDTLIIDKQLEGWEIETTTDTELANENTNVISMVEATLPDSLNSIIWTITTEPEPMADGQLMFSEFVDITDQAQHITQTGYSKMRIKHYITMFVAHGFSDLTKTTDIYSSLEHAGSVLSDILKNKLTQNWKLTTYTNEEISKINSNAISMIQGTNPSGTLAVTWVLHPDPALINKDGVLFPDYIYIAERSRDYSEMEDGEQVVELSKMASMSAGEGFIYALIETIKMYPVASAGIGFFLTWLFFL